MRILRVKKNYLPKIDTVQNEKATRCNCSIQTMNKHNSANKAKKKKK